MNENCAALRNERRSRIRQAKQRHDFICTQLDLRQLADKRQSLVYK
jgi:hypothetical protein